MLCNAIVIGFAFFAWKYHGIYVPLAHNCAMHIYGSNKMLHWINFDIIEWCQNFIYVTPWLPMHVQCTSMQDLNIHHGFLVLHDGNPFSWAAHFWHHDVMLIIHECKTLGYAQLWGNSTTYCALYVKVLIKTNAAISLNFTMCSCKGITLPHE